MVLLRSIDLPKPSDFVEPKPNVKPKNGFDKTQQFFRIQRFHHNLTILARFYVWTQPWVTESLEPLLWSSYLCHCKSLPGIGFTL